MRRRTSAALAASLLAAGLTPLVLSAPASAAVAKHYDDFNGDGYRDVAYGGFSRGSLGGGAVTVVYGSASGLDTSHTQVIDQESPGVPGASEEDDSFGESLASADLNKDGYADLVVGNGTEHVGSVEYRGTVTIVWGSASGLSGGTNVAPKSGANGEFAHFGSDLATGDFNGDGSPDLAVIGGEEAWLYRGSFTKSGSTGTVSKIDKTDGGWYSYGLAAGKVNGDGKTDLVVLGTQLSGSEESHRVWFLKGASGGLTSGASKTFDSSVLDASIGDFDKDGYGDIALGQPDRSTGKGAVTVWRGTSSGPSGSATFTQATSGVSGTPEADDNFGYDVSAADTNGDGYADLAVGVPHEDVDGTEDQGGVHLFRGGSGGLSGARSSWIPQTVTGADGSDASFGYTVRLRDLNADGKADLGVGAAGTSVLLRGTSTVPTADGVIQLPEFGGAFLD
ncbi:MULTISPECIES: FG-GAP and VCBS repeat-containing protein [unclassified Streptomyces]|uniref:FG-GAP and VCBS repeat-containing protein n=1 Tax=unclassified Streptomyces TaxID=2593676 RepID=UPI002E80A22E|nr:FG-GAP and VCBS repeat-containing protein [Streptomyces sp. NBC_00589]WTI37654.1 FG-GAP and VCBS repeat-containing protein [Streptomyces sp. NBC_00775]WUB28668.1 FG-GAP and VCBS repeat-containing protein [Streptomyces sp. NBC_00589]